MTTDDKYADSLPPGSFQITLKAFLCKGDELLILNDKEAQVGDLPGGRLARSEFYEDWSLALRREIREELGENVQFNLNEKHLFIFPHFVLQDKTECLGVAYAAEYLGGEIKLSQEHDSYQWVKIDSYEPGDYFQDSLGGAILRFRQGLRGQD